jgi:hypothetical protein
VANGGILAGVLSGFAFGRVLSLAGFSAFAPLEECPAPLAALATDEAVGAVAAAGKRLVRTGDFGCILLLGDVSITFDEPSGLCNTGGILALLPSESIDINEGIARSGFDITGDFEVDLTFSFSGAFAADLDSATVLSCSVLEAFGETGVFSLGVFELGGDFGDGWLRSVAGEAFAGPKSLPVLTLTFGFFESMATCTFGGNECISNFGGLFSLDFAVRKDCCCRGAAEAAGAAESSKAEPFSMAPSPPAFSDEAML